MLNFSTASSLFYKKFSVCFPALGKWVIGNMRSVLQASVLFLYDLF